MSTVDETTNTVLHAPLIELLSHRGDDKLRTTRRVNAFLAVFMDVEVTKLSEAIRSRKDKVDG